MYNIQNLTHDPSFAHAPVFTDFGAGLGNVPLWCPDSQQRQVAAASSICCCQTGDWGTLYPTGTGEVYFRLELLGTVVIVLCSFFTSQGLNNVVTSTTQVQDAYIDSQKHALEFEYLQETSEQISQVYTHIAKFSPLLDVRFLLPHLQPQVLRGSFPLQNNVDVVLSPLPSIQEVKSLPAYHLLSVRLKPDWQPEFQQIIEGDSIENLQTPSKSDHLVHTFSDIALGGTFDNIHDGHRLLLTQSALMATSRVLVGIANGPLLASKVLPELIKPVTERIFEVKSFLADVKPWIQHQVEAITDIFGPTAWDKELVCLVVTPETARGGEKVNAERKRKVGTHCVPVA